MKPATWLSNGRVSKRDNAYVALAPHLVSRHNEEVLGVWGMKSIVRRLARLSPSMELKSRNFPAALKSQIEFGDHILPKKKILDRAVIGCADLTWPEPQDSADVMDAWTAKQKFFAIATKCATDNGMIVIQQSGDGIVFLLNYIETTSWTTNLMNFQDALRKQFGDMGVRIGVSMGTTAVGYINDDPSTFTALGPEVDLAIRLCRQSLGNQLIVSTRVWYTLGETLSGWGSRLTHFKVRGFEQIIPCMQLDSETNLFQQAG